MICMVQVMCKTQNSMWWKTRVEIWSQNHSSPCSHWAPRNREQCTHRMHSCNLLARPPHNTHHDACRARQSHPRDRNRAFQRWGHSNNRMELACRGMDTDSLQWPLKSVKLLIFRHFLLRILLKSQKISFHLWNCLTYSFRRPLVQKQKQEGIKILTLIQLKFTALIVTERITGVTFVLLLLHLSIHEHRTEDSIQRLRELADSKLFNFILGANSY